MKFFTDKQEIIYQGLLTLAKGDDHLVVEALRKFNTSGTLPDIMNYIKEKVNERENTI